MAFRPRSPSLPHRPTEKRTHRPATRPPPTRRHQPAQAHPAGHPPPSAARIAGHRRAGSAPVRCAGRPPRPRAGPRAPGGTRARAQGHARSTRPQGLRSRGRLRVRNSLYLTVRGSVVVLARGWPGGVPEARGRRVRVGVGGVSGAAKGEGWRALRGLSVAACGGVVRARDAQDGRQCASLSRLFLWGGALQRHGGESYRRTAMDDGRSRESRCERACSGRDGLQACYGRVFRGRK